ncbi:hypothetical protein ID866_4899 [Astraeus odoratus]|nr:hypothetical protein ID866_4899 [Astraeus odoratus]
MEKSQTAHAPGDAGSYRLYKWSAISALMLWALSRALDVNVYSQVRWPAGGAPSPPLHPSANSSECPQYDVLHPVLNADLDAHLDTVYASEAFKLQSYDLLSGAIRIPTESHDTSGPVGQDPVWDVFADLHEYLERAFPLVYAKLKIDTPSDVVPVNPATVTEWEHHPYSGHYDGTWIWGRGSCDDKSDLIARLITIDSLLQSGFSPARTIVVAFGFDEEATGLEGAGHIAAYLEETYGYAGFAMLVDEGGAMGSFGDGFYFASPSLSEKGYMDVLLEVASPGGHSSVPPDHTVGAVLTHASSAVNPRQSIGLLSMAIAALEQNPHPPELVRDGTPFATVQCLAEYSPVFPDDLRTLARKAAKDGAALAKLKDGLAKLSPTMKAMMGTTQAVDVIEGGVKVNALPERATALVNHRIAEHSSVADLQQHLADVLSPVAERHDLALRAFGKTIRGGNSGELVVSDAFGTAVEPSPITPVGYGPYSVFSGTIKATMMSSKLYNAAEVIVSPALSLGNTDTMQYWNLTKHIFRFSFVTQDDYYNGIHTVNEALRAESMVEGIRFLTKLILNVDESLLL